MKIQYEIIDQYLTSCFEVMKEPRLRNALESYLIAKEAMKKEGYNLMYLEDAGHVVSVAGLRFTTTLYDGAIIDFDDFVTPDSGIGKSYAAKMLS